MPSVIVMQLRYAFRVRHEVAPLKRINRVQPGCPRPVF